MYIIIVGLGGIGRSLVKQAVEHGNNVVVIDHDENRCSEILEHYDILAVTGNATDKTTLEEAGIDRTEAFVATTSDDSVNLMACWLAKRFHVPNVVAIVNQTAHSDFFKEVGVRISENPDELVASRLYYWTENPHSRSLPRSRAVLFLKLSQKRVLRLSAMRSANSKSRISSLLRYGDPGAYSLSRAGV